MKKIYGMAIIVLLAGMLMACDSKNIDSNESVSIMKENEHVPGEPDVISSIRTNNDERLLIIANRDEIEDKIEFAKLLIKMCQENSFKTIKFSTDCGYATRLNMRVYLWRNEIEGNDPVMTVDFKPIEWNKGYDIVNNPEMFELYIDDTLVETE